MAVYVHANFRGQIHDCDWTRVVPIESNRGVCERELKSYPSLVFVEPHHIFLYLRRIRSVTFLDLKTSINFAVL